jgi:hypothetical protein
VSVAESKKEHTQEQSRYIETGTEREGTSGRLQPHQKVPYKELFLSVTFRRVARLSTPEGPSVGQLEAS